MGLDGGGEGRGGDGHGYGGGGGGDGRGGGGHGCGDGYGYGGDGHGYDGGGCGDGYGDGHGYCDDGRYSSYWSAVLAEHAVPGAEMGFWWSDSAGLPVNGGAWDRPAAVGMVQEIAGPLVLCSHALHATADPARWYGDRLWVVALHGPVAVGHGKIGALRREFVAEVSRR